MLDAIFRECFHSLETRTKTGLNVLTPTKTTGNTERNAYEMNLKGE